VMHLDRGAFSTNSALCFKPGRTEVHREGAVPAQPPSKGGPETSSHAIQALASSDTGSSNRRPRPSDRQRSTSPSSHPAKHHAEIVCGHFGDRGARESNGLGYCSDRLEVS
jgi:hypothetical protein